MTRDAGTGTTTNTGAEAGPEGAAAHSAPLLRIEDLRVEYAATGGTVPALRGVSLTLRAGEVLALVGESGSGKSTIAHTVLGTLPPAARVTGGSVTLEGTELVGLPERSFDRLRGRKIGFVPQDPMVGLNPVHRVGKQVSEPLRIHRLAGRKEARERAVALLDRVGLPEPATRARQYPHQLSGGMRQRALIATALAAEPVLLVADEPTTALDVTVQRRILDDIAELTTSRGIAMLLITHDLALAGDRADRIVVLRDGLVVEQGTPDEVLGNPRAEFTRELLAAAPSLRPAVPRPGAQDRPRPGDETPLVRVEGLDKSFPVPHPQEKNRLLPAVSDVSFTLARGETLALVGESGSGKTTTARIVLGLERATGGRVLFDGAHVETMDRTALRELRSRAQLVYQNPYASLDPRMSVRDIVTEPLLGYRIGDAADRRARFAELMDRVHLPAALHDRRVGELSGGQRQRVAIARALAPSPDLVVCDEPVSALDVSVQARILDLLAELQDELGVSYLFISHDLAVVRQIAHRVGVMRGGKLLEIGPTEDIFTSPQDPYTRQLLDAVPGRRFFEAATGRVA